MRKGFAVLFIFIASVFYGQNTDSLKLALKNAKHDTTRCTILSELVETTSDKECMVFNEQLKILAEKNLTANTGLKKIYLKHLSAALNNTAVLAEQTGDFSKALEYNHKSLKISEELGDKEGIEVSLSNIGNIYENQGETNKALEYYSGSLKMLKETGNKRGIARSLNNFAGVYSDQGNIALALEYYHQSLKILEEINDKNSMASSLNNIGLIYSTQGDLPKALEYNQKSLKIREQIGDKNGITVSLNNIGSIYKKQGNLAGAIEYYQKSLKISEETGNKEGVAMSLNNIGSIYSLTDITMALEYFQKSLKIQEEIGHKKGILHALSNIARLLLKKGNTDKALLFAKKGMEAAKATGYPEHIENYANVLKKIFQKQNNYKEALKMYELEILMRDSIVNQENKKVSIKNQFKYEYEKKAAADSVKNGEEQKVKDAQLAAQTASLKQEKFQRYSLVVGLLIVLGGLGFVINRFRITNKQKKIIEEQKVKVDEAFEKLNEKNKEVMDSIYYARRIQRALITNEKYIERTLKKINKP